MYQIKKLTRNKIKTKSKKLMNEMTEKDRSQQREMCRERKKPTSMSPMQCEHTLDTDVALLIE